MGVNQIGISEPGMASPAIRMALQRCPNLIVLPTRFDVYRREAAIIRGILYQFTSIIEPLSLDEAYLDVSAHPSAPAALAQEIRSEIFRTTKLTSSAGIGPNKLIAKIASEINKPNGQFEVRPEQVADFMDPLKSDELDAALSNCLSCKGCTPECPSNVNLALLKAEMLHARWRRDGLPLRERILSNVDLLGKLGCLMARDSSPTRPFGRTTSN